MVLSWIRDLARGLSMYFVAHQLFPNPIAELAPPQIPHGLLSKILTISEREERCKGMQIEGDEYRGMGLAGALTEAQFVALIHYPNCRALYYCSSYPKLFRVVSYQRARCSRSVKRGTTPRPDCAR